MLTAFTDYLKVAANAKGDLSRPRQLIGSLLAQEGMPANIHNQLLEWQTAIKEVEAGNYLRSTDVKTARKMLDEGRALMEFPRDRDGIIHYLVAAAILNRYVHSHPDHGADVAEAYYMLGITESLLAHSFWVSREEFDFESAIRLAPGAQFAPKAYNLLEDSLTFSFSGSGGTHLPDEAKALLADLHKLIADARATKS